MPYVEYADTEDMSHLKRVELHFRSSDSAGENAVNAWTFQEGLKVPKTGLHVHMPTEFPLEKLTKDPALGAAELLDFYRRAELVAQFSSIVDEKVQINSRGASFGSLGVSGLADIHTGVLNAVENGLKQLPDEKLGWIGYRSGQVYLNSTLHGLEYRSLSSRSDRQNSRALLDVLQASWVSFAKRPVQTEFSNWYHWAKERDPNLVKPLITPLKHRAKYLGMLWYDRPWTNLVESLSEELRIHYLAIPEKILHQVVDLSDNKNSSFNHREVKMVFHDWSNDPLVFDQPDLKNKILDAQKDALRRIATGEDAVRVTRNFLVGSNLYRVFLKSIGR